VLFSEYFMSVWNILCCVGIECAVFRIFYDGLEYFVSIWNNRCCFHGINCAIVTVRAEVTNRRIRFRYENRVYLYHGFRNKMC